MSTFLPLALILAAAATAPVRPWRADPTFQAIHARLSTILRMPFDVEEAFGTRARVPVKGTAPRPVSVPKDLKAALAKRARARAFFEGLPPSHRRAYVDWIEEAKKAETRERRLRKAVEMLEAGEERM